MTGTDAVLRDALDVANRFILGLNARDVDMLRGLIAEDAEFRRTDGTPLHGADGVRELVSAAQNVGIELVPFRPGEARQDEGFVEVTIPVRELVGPDDIERVAAFEIRDGRVAWFALRPME